MAKAPPRDRSAAPLSPTRDQGDNGPTNELTVLERSARRLGFEICGLPCGVDNWGVCRKQKGHPGHVHHPAHPDEPVPFDWDQRDSEYTNDPRREQDDVLRSIS